MQLMQCYSAEGGDDFDQAVGKQRDIIALIGKLLA